MQRHPAGGDDIAVGFGSVWMTGSGNEVVRLDPSDGSKQTSIKVPAGVHGLVTGLGAVWASTGDAGEWVFRIDPRHNRLVTKIATAAGSFPDRMAFARGAVWVGEFRNASMIRIDPQSNKVTSRLRAGEGSAVVAAGFGSLWIDNYYSNTVWRVRP